MADFAQVERRLHSCQVLLWLRQTYEAVENHHEVEAIPKEAVYCAYVDMCRSELSSGPLFTRAVVGKMVKRAFPSVLSRRLGSRGQIKQYYTGLRRRTTSLPSSPSPSSTSATAEVETKREPKSSPSSRGSATEGYWIKLEPQASPDTANCVDPAFLSPTASRCSSTRSSFISACGECSDISPCTTDAAESVPMHMAWPHMYLDETCTPWDERAGEDITDAEQCSEAPVVVWAESVISPRTTFSDS